MQYSATDIYPSLGLIVDGEWIGRDVRKTLPALDPASA